MVAKGCAACGAVVDMRGRQRFCPPCGKRNQLELKRQADQRQALTHPEEVRARKKRYRDSHRELTREWAKRPKYKAARTKARDERRFSGVRVTALERDGRRCRLCLATTADGVRNLVIHHIDGTKDNNVLDNLITLCRSCHPSVHGKHGAIRQEELKALITRATSG
jgi:5-methylcytosine-specific restriction endonuclease McrA